MLSLSFYKIHLGCWIFHRISERNSVSFPADGTKLKLVDLSANCLKNLSMASIGHTGRTTHNVLYSLDLTGNKDISEGDILS